MCLNDKSGHTMITGFSNVRTSEYTILYDLYERIKDKSSYFYPFFFHKRRDDTSLSMSNNITDLHLIACFARRPKTDFHLSDYSYISFRRSIFEQVDVFQKYKIPVIAASPLGTGIEKIGFGSKCQWFELKPGIDKEYVEYEFVNNNTNQYTLISGINLLDSESLDSILKSAPLYHWNHIVQLIQNWYYEYVANHALNMFNSVSGQRPIFIVYKLSV